MRNFLLILFTMFSSAVCAADYQCVKTDNGAKLVKDGTVIWEQVIKTPEGKPYIHPVTLPNGHVISDLRPKDHPWHTGLWFSWKFINGVNYWEPSYGKTEVVSWNADIDGLSAAVTMKLRYFDDREADVTRLWEDRVVVFSAPDEEGNYTISFKHHFTAGDADLTFDRTPLSIRWGGYAGLSLRMNQSVRDFRLTCENGGETKKTIRAKPASWCDFRDEKSGQGVRFIVLKGTEQTRFYILDGGHYCIIPSPIHEGPITCKAGDSFDLEYVLMVGSISS
ncbi:MAG: PmoA family protein [Thermoguttaceae bacterium]|nr:PmoA family protein [Thermoguttaceae bacterium]